METEATPAEAEVSELELVKQVSGRRHRRLRPAGDPLPNGVFGMIYNMVHSEQDAWDLAQDSFVKAWKSIARFPRAVLVLHLDLSHRDQCDD